MSTYRSAPKRLKPIVIRQGRSWILIGIMVLFTGPFIAIPYAFSRSSLTCSRSADSCVLEVVRGPEVWKSQREFRQTAIEKAFVDDSIDSDGDKLWGIALLVDNATIIIDGRSNVWIDDKYLWAKAVNDYLQNPVRDHFEIHDGSTWPAFLISFFIVLIIVATIRARTRFIIDHEQGVFRIEERIFRTSFEDIALDQIAMAVIDEKEDEGTMVTGVALQLVNGTRKIVHSYSNIDHQSKARLLEQINAALDRAKR